MLSFWYFFFVPKEKVSQDNTNQSTAALVDDAFERFGKFGARILGNVGELGVKSLADQLAKGLAKHIGIPNLARVIFKFTEQEIHKLL